MAISEKIKAEAQRTIELMRDFHKQYSGAESAEELEHRIARVETSMEGCNGLTQEEKIQKTAENMFELTCARERQYDALRAELWKNRAEYQNEFRLMRKELKEGLQSVMQKIEESGMDSSAALTGKGGLKHFLRIVSCHPLLSVNTFLFVLILVFVSGHFDKLLSLFAKGA